MPRAVRPARAWTAAALAFGVFFPFLIFGAGLEKKGPQPFRAGEKLVFELRWTFIPAGQAILEVLPDTTVQGRPARHFRLTARSNAFIDAFYKVRDIIDAYTDPDLTRSVSYRKKQREGSTHRDVTVVFDWQAETARYANRDEVKPPIALMPGSFDPLSAFYYLRNLPLEAGATIERPITDGKKNVVGRARVVRREKIRVSGRTWDTYLIEPELRHVGGVFEKSPKAKIQVWVTADHRRLPVRLKSKVVVGSFVGDLVSDAHVKSP